MLLGILVYFKTFFSQFVSIEAFRRILANGGLIHFWMDSDAKHLTLRDHCISIFRSERHSIPESGVLRTLKDQWIYRGYIYRPVDTSYVMKLITNTTVFRC